MPWPAASLARACVKHAAPRMNSTLAGENGTPGRIDQFTSAGPGAAAGAHEQTLSLMGSHLANLETLTGRTDTAALASLVGVRYMTLTCRYMTAACRYMTVTCRYMTVT